MLSAQISRPYPRPHKSALYLECANILAMNLDLTLVFATEVIVESVEHVLGENSCEEKLRKDLTLWKTGKRDCGEGYEYCHPDGFIPFDMVGRLHEQLKITPLSV